ncbi:MAG: aldo/keto reductase, partial [Opitutales bacterium]|nr:aldo/keto reductase [Opitutales bacterium]
MKKRLLGNTKLEVSPLAVGCWAFAGGANWGDQDERKSVAVVHAALDQGINLFDTAPGYGNGESERVLGIALKGRRDQAIIATKIKDIELDAISLRASCEKSLSLLQT